MLKVGYLWIVVQRVLLLYNVSFVGNICKLMLTPTVLTSLNVICPTIFYLTVK